jgi:hypothetical protein
VNGGVKPHFRLLIAHNSTHGKPNVLQCEFIRYSGMANSLEGYAVGVTKSAAFWLQGLIRRLEID